MEIVDNDNNTDTDRELLVTTEQASQTVIDMITTFDQPTEDYDIKAEYFLDKEAPQNQTVHDYLLLNSSNLETANFTLTTSTPEDTVGIGLVFVLVSLSVCTVTVAILAFVWLWGRCNREKKWAYRSRGTLVSNQVMYMVK